MKMIMIALLMSASFGVSYYLGDTVRRATLTTRIMWSLDLTIDRIGGSWLVSKAMPEFMRGAYWHMAAEMDVRNSHWRSVLIGVECYKCALDRVEREEFMRSMDSKSSLLREWAEKHPDVRMFEVPLDSTTQPEDIFGPADINRMVNRMFGGR